MIGIGHERRAEELLEQAARGTAVGAHAALFHHHVALLVELAHHRMQQAVRLQRGPQLELVRRHGVHVAGLVVVGEGVHAHAAVALDDFAELVVDDVLVGGLDRILPGLLQLRQLLRILAHALDALGLIGGVGLLDLCQRDLLGGIVGGADVGRALEGHVLHHVRQAGFVQRILRRAGIDHGEEREHRRLGPAPQDDGQTVRQSLDRDPLLVGRQVLRRQRQRQQEQKTAGESGVSIQPPRMGRKLLQSQSSQSKTGKSNEASRRAWCSRREPWKSAPSRSNVVSPTVRT